MSLFVLCKLLIYISLFGFFGRLYLMRNGVDDPVLFPDMMTNIWSAVNRQTRSGRVLGDYHRITPYQALEAITIHAAYQNFEEDSKGSIEVGKRADFVILDANPLEVNADDIKHITVLETIKDGETVFSFEKQAND